MSCSLSCRRKHLHLHLDFWSPNCDTVNSLTPPGWCFLRAGALAGPAAPKAFTPRASHAAMAGSGERRADGPKGHSVAAWRQVREHRLREGGLERPKAGRCPSQLVPGTPEPPERRDGLFRRDGQRTPALALRNAVGTAASEHLLMTKGEPTFPAPFSRETSCDTERLPQTSLEPPLLEVSVPVSPRGALDLHAGECGLAG